MTAIRNRDESDAQGQATGPLPVGEDDEFLEPELVTDETIETLLRGAKILVTVVNVVVLMTFSILALGFLLHLAGASPEASFVDWVYRTTERAMQPFRGMYPIQEIDGRSVFDASLLFAAAMYGFMAICLHGFVVYLSAYIRRYHRRTVEAENRSRSTPGADEYLG
ncbi:MAG: YggT family protein [Acidimicrobiia bacterium]|nr:YggT family protein [Acidimicrobiia bacterium]MDH5519040.1 YggT family protein [Acidimicrobiia bacterium]